MLRKFIIALLFVSVFMPTPLWAESEIELKELKKVKEDFEKGHKKEIKSDLKETKISDELDLEKNHFSFDTRIGATNMTGNTKSIAVNGTNVTKYRVKRFENTWKAGAFYSRVFSSTNTSSSIGTSARFIYGNYRLDYFIHPRFTYFIGGGGYTNEIKGMELAGQGFTGFKYYFLKSPTYYFSGALGYNFTYEDRMPPDPTMKIHSAAAMFDYEQKFKDNLKLENHLEILEDVQNGHEIRVNNDLSFRVLFTEHLGLGLGFIVMFDNRPPTGYKKLDTITNFTFVVNF